MSYWRIMVVSGLLLLLVWGSLLAALVIHVGVPTLEQHPLNNNVIETTTSDNE